MADFQTIKEQVPIEAAAQLLGLELKQAGVALRGPCPKCQSGGDRALVVTPARRAYFCFAQNKGGSVLDLWAHIEGCSLPEAGKAIEDSFGLERLDRSPSPVKKAPQKVASKPPTPFDPAAFAEKLEYTEAVSALGISEEDARALGIGMYRGKMYQALRYDDGSTAGYSAITGDIKLPSKLLPQVHNVVAFPKRA
jgi:DNA primase